MLTWAALFCRELPTLDLIPEQFDTLASWDPYTAYDPLLALSDEGKVSVRVRIFFLSMDKNPDVPLTTERVLNAFSNFGDDMVRSSGIGEFATSWPLFGNPFPTNFVKALTIVAQRGWAFQQHSLSLLEDQFAPARSRWSMIARLRSPTCAGRSRTCRKSIR